MENIILTISGWFKALGTTGLVINAGIESCLPGFPLPPDVLLFAMNLAAPQKALLYALICTLGSLGGGIIGYLFGKYGGRPLFNLLFKKNSDKIDAVEKLYEQYGSFALFISAFSPIPYNIFTIASGILKMNIFKFIAVSFLGRGGRFFFESIILMLFGEVIKQYMNYVIAAVSIVLVAFFVILYKKRHSIIKNEDSDVVLMETKSVKTTEKAEKEVCR